MPQIVGLGEGNGDLCGLALGDGLTLPLGDGDGDALGDGTGSVGMTVKVGIGDCGAAGA